MSVTHWTLENAQNAQIARYIHFACNTVWTWDALISFSDDVDMFTNRRTTWVDIVYATSRLFTGLTVYSALPFIVKPLSDCNVMLYTFASLGVVAGWLSTLLFLFRVNGVYYDSPLAKRFFTCMWVFACTGCLALPVQYAAAAPSPPDSLCVVLSIKRFTSLAMFPVAMFDLVVFGAISFRVVKIFTPHTHWLGICKTFITCADIGTIPEALLRTGQLYVLPMLCWYGFVLWFENSSTLERLVLYQYLMAAFMAGLIVMNSLACRVFRLLRNFKAEDGQGTVLSTMVFRQYTQRRVDRQELM